MAIIFMGGSEYEDDGADAAKADAPAPPVHDAAKLAALEELAAISIMRSLCTIGEDSAMILAAIVMRDTFSTDGEMVQDPPAWYRAASERAVDRLIAVAGDPVRLAKIKPAAHGFLVKLAKLAIHDRERR